MNNEHLRQTLKLLKRTGDKGIIFDNESDSVFVLMNTGAYEQMLDKLEQLELNKNLVAGFDERKAPWEQSSFTEDEMDDYVLDDYVQNDEQRRATENAGEPSHALAKEPIRPKKDTFEKLEFSEDWTNSSKPAINNLIIKEENLSDVPDDGEEEEKFYLEPVE